MSPSLRTCGNLAAAQMFSLRNKAAFALLLGVLSSLSTTTRLAGAARLLRRGGGNRATGFAYEYSHHGEDWVQGSCGSRERQSPINFDAGVMSAPATGKLQYTYQLATSGFEIQNNGHTLAAELAGMGFGGITYDNGWYSLMNVNVHAESEHTFNGMHHPLELHLVHKKEDSDALLVVAIPFVSASPPALLQGRQVPPATPTLPPSQVQPMNYIAPPPHDLDFNTQLQFFLKTKPPMMNEKVTAIVDEYAPFDMNKLLEGGSYFEYAGSLTAPPCAEIVTWFVRREPLLASDAQVSILHHSVYQISADFGNYRSVMPLNARPVAIRQAVKEEPPPKTPEQSVPLGPNPAPRGWRTCVWMTGWRR